MTTPRCPHCNTQGPKHLACQQVGHFLLIYCGQCGAIYGVVPANSTPTPPQQQTQTPPPPEPLPDLPPAAEPETPPGPEPEPAPEPQPVPVPDVPPPPGLLGLAGNTDINLAPISPDDARQRIKMVNMFGPGGQRFLNVMGETGTCPTCNQAMTKLTIPTGYPNSGRTIFYCPNYDECGQWYFVFEAVK